jgi:hypothetical protein
MRLMIALGVMSVACAAVAGGDLGDKGPSRLGTTVGDTLVGEPALCVYPAHDRAGAGEAAGLRVVTVGESEVNNTIGAANSLPLSAAEPAVDVTGSLTSNDVDFYSVTLSAGQWLNVAMSQAGSSVDSRLAVFEPGQSFEAINDDDNGVSGVYPTSSTLLRTSGLNPNLVYIAPTSGTYYIRADGFNSASTGPYTMQVRLQQGGVETLPPGEKQIIFVDFNGATVNAVALFGGGNVNANLSQMSNFLPAWGLANNSTNLNAIIDGVMAKIEQNLEELRVFEPGLNYELRNSRDDADPFGQPNVSRLIVGGTQQELGIGTIGIAESIDPGNYEREETAVILLDILSDAGFSIACQNQSRAPGATVIDAIVRGVGNIATHEAGHYLGAFHTVNTNSTPCLIDSGGGLFEQNIYDTGPDGVIGSADDFESAFRRDAYANEGVALSGSFENVGWRVGAGLRVQQTCAADVNGDNTVDGADLGVLLGAWGGGGGPTDLNGDGLADGADLGILLGAWGPC